MYIPWKCCLCSVYSWIILVTLHVFVYPPATTGNNSHCCGFINIHGINFRGFNQIKFPGYVICGQWSKQYNMVSDFDWTMISKKNMCSTNTDETTVYCCHENINQKQHFFTKKSLIHLCNKKSREHHLHT